MRARAKRRQRIRRLTIVVTMVVIAVSLVFGFYILANLGSSALDAYIGKTVSTSEVNHLYQMANSAYGPSGSSMLVTGGNFKTASGAPYLQGSKPIIVYIGAEFCPYCAVERWSLILALSRFGNFTNLHYTTSASDEGDYATFTFVGSSYSSRYIAFQPFEQEDRNRGPLQTVPANYSAEFTNSYPYVNFANSYILLTLQPDPAILAGKNWSQIYSSISAGDSLGLAIKEGANAITAVICKVTSGAPSSVCTQPSVDPSGYGLQAPISSTESIVPPAHLVPSPVRIPRLPQHGRLGT